MSGITLSASVRQNLLSLQSTTQLLATTQNDLATGNKVNSALDNPTNYFTAQSLNTRASDISNLLDGISNGVQVLQAANTGITSLKSLLDTAKSIANQALQATSGYSQKSSFSATIAGATSANLLGTASYANASATGTALNNNHTGAYQSATGTSSPVAATKTTLNAGTETGTSLAGVTDTTATVGQGGTLDLSALDGKSITVGSTTISFSNAATSTTGAGTNAVTIGVGNGSTSTLGDVLSAITTAAGNGATSSVDNTTGAVTLTSGTTGGIDFTGADKATVLNALGLTSADIDPTSSTSTVTADATTKLAGTGAGAGGALSAPVAAGSSFSINGKSFSFYDASNGGTAGTDANTTYIDISTKTLGDVADDINTAVGAGTATIAGGKLSLSTGTSQDLTVTDGTPGALASLGLTAGPIDRTTAAPASTAAITAATKLSQAGSPTSNGLSSAFTSSDTITVNGKTIAFYDGANGGSAGTDANTTYLDLSTSSVGDVLSAVDNITGATGASASSVDANGEIKLSTGTAADLQLGGTGLAKLGLTAGTTHRALGANNLSGQTLTIGATAGGAATSITFGTGTGQISTLSGLNSALAANNLMASIDTSGKLTISTTNDNASATIGDVGGTATAAGADFENSAGVQGQPQADANSQSTRANLVTQYNNIIDQIRTTAQDASFNGVNLLNGDQLKLVFNETGSSTLNIQGSTDDPSGLGLSKLNAGSDFLDNTGTNKVLTSLTNASDALASQASTLGSNLSMVQIRQTFSQNLINVLQTGASNLTLADPNEEAANSQALSTRQSIAVSALALANQSQQSVLRLLQ